jgi:AAA family ATP:ADP antiporter
VIDTVAYRFGDLSSAWVQAGLRYAGFGLGGAVVLGIGASVFWGWISTRLGKQYETIRAQQARVRLTSQGPGEDGFQSCARS